MMYGKDINELFAYLLLLAVLVTAPWWAELLPVSVQ